MHKSGTSLILIPLFAVLGNAQSLLPSHTYKLHVVKPPVRAAIALTQDQTLLDFLGSRKGDGEIRRLTGWWTSDPREDSLKLVGFPRGLEPAAGHYRGSSLLVSPDQRYAIAKTEGLAPGKQKMQAIINIVDLPSFKVVHALDTTDPLLAASQWFFAPNGTLLSTRLVVQKVPPVLLQQVAALSMPDLHEISHCQYNETRLDHPGQAHDEFEHGPSADAGKCEALLKSVGGQTMDDLAPPDRQNLQGFANRIGLRPLPGCSILQISKENRIALYDCGAGHHTWYDSYKITDHHYVIASLPQAKEIGSAAVNPNANSFAIIASADGKDYLLVLLDGRDLSVYPLDSNR
jgi:hypothetical protein